MALVAVAGLTVSLLAPSSTAQAGPSRRAERTFGLASLPAAADLPNPLRGQYRWLGAEPTPATATANDVYFRDQVYWGRIEPADDQWDFTWIDAGLAAAGERGGKFGFRVMAYCPGCWMNYREGFPAVTPSFVPRQAGTDIPDWNSAAFRAQWRALMAELGRRYGDDPRLGYVDVGGYGSYGEWHVGEGERVSEANGLAIVDAVASAFPTKHVLINTMTSVELTLKALAAHPHLGIRTDSLGCPDMYSMVAVDERLQSVWRTRPFFSEWCTRADPVLGAQQVRQFHVSTLSSGNMPWSHDALTARQRAAYATALAAAGYRIRLRSLTLPRSIAADRRLVVRTSWANGAARRRTTAGTCGSPSSGRAGRSAPRSASRSTGSSLPRDAPPRSRSRGCRRGGTTSSSASSTRRATRSRCTSPTPVETSSVPTASGRSGSADRSGRSRFGIVGRIRVLMQAHRSPTEEDVMRAVVYTESGDSSVLELVERDAAEPGPGEVRVRIVRAGVNPTDWKFRAGGMGGLAFPEIVPGQDGSGVVDAVGPDVTGLAVGDRVWTMLAQHTRPGGTAQELVVLPVANVAALPDAASYDIGASLGVPAVTAHRALTTSEDGPDRLAPGALAGLTVLVAGGAGAVGNAAIQLARWAGATVITTVSSDEKAALAPAAGAHHVVNYREATRPRRSATSPRTGSTSSSRWHRRRTCGSTWESSSPAGRSRSTPTTAATR